MSEHRATVAWSRDTDDFTYESYTRDHTWAFEGGTVVPASAATAYLGSAECVDPEEALVAALSSCHMLTFLAIAAKKRWVVDSYRDAAVGFMEKNAEGRLAITRVVLRPEIAFAGDAPDEAALARLHHLAHEQCFIANSVRTEVTVEEA
jgi:organic hydroperoxide reductase OsmC/OhrA